VTTRSQASGRDRLNREDLVLDVHGVPRDTIEAIQCARIVAAELTTIVPGQSGSLGAVAERTGYSLYTVQQMVASPRYRQLLRDGLLHRLHSSIDRAISSMDDIVENAEKASDRIAATKTLTGIYTAISSVQEANAQDASELAFTQLFDRIQQRQRLRRITIGPDDQPEGSRHEDPGPEGQATDDDPGGPGAP
jgi:hypothetical protein